MTLLDLETVEDKICFEYNYLKAPQMLFSSQTYEISNKIIRTFRRGTILPPGNKEMQLVEIPGCSLYVNLNVAQHAGFDM